MLNLINQLTVADAFRDNFPNEILIKVDSADVTGEHVDLDIDEKSVGQHQLEGLMVGPLTKNNPLGLEFLLELLEQSFQLRGVLVLGGPNETSCFRIVPFRLIVLIRG
jgi:hypothetical protein